jgi:ATP-binding cassette subfamily B (MDR/TAP) protein 1
MSLLFGRLTQDFVNFSSLTNLADGGDPVAQAQIPAAAASFRSSASKNAAYLTAIGRTAVKVRFKYLIDCCS